MNNEELCEILNNIYLLHQLFKKNDFEYEKFRGHRNTSNYYLTLIILKEHGKWPLSKIGNLMSIKKQSMTYIADILVENGLVMRVPCNDDRRVINLAITNKGEECLNEWQKNRIKKVNELFTYFNDEELKKFSFQLKKLVRAL